MRRLQKLHTNCVSMWPMKVKRLTQDKIAGVQTIRNSSFHDNGQTERLDTVWECLKENLEFCTDLRLPPWQKWMSWPSEIGDSVDCRWKRTLQAKLLSSYTLKRYSEETVALRNICSPVTDHAILRHRRQRGGRLNYFHLLDDGFSNYSAHTTTETPTTAYWYAALFKNSEYIRG